MPCLPHGGFPHSEITGSQLICSSPMLFAAYRVLLRQSVPGHPPCALISLIFYRRNLLVGSVRRLRFKCCRPFARSSTQAFSLSVSRKDYHLLLSCAVFKVRIEVSPLQGLALKFRSFKTIQSLLKNVRSVSFFAVLMFSGSCFLHPLPLSLLRMLDLGIRTALAILVSLERR